MLSHEECAERHQFWCNTLGPEYALAGKAERIRMKREYKDSINTTPTKEEPMFNERETQIRYLKDRLWEIREDLWTKGRKVYIDSPRPATIGEAKQWLADGNYIFNTEKIKDEASYESYCLTAFFRWGKKPMDEKGFEAW